MLSYKMDFSSCDIMPGFGKSSHNYAVVYIVFAIMVCTLDYLCSIQYIIIMIMLHLQCNNF